MTYTGWKILHLITLAAWLGPAFGGFWILVTTGRKTTPELRLQLEAGFEQIVRAEHMAFVLLIISGFLMVREAGWDYLNEKWLAQKLYLVSLIALIELGDFLVSNILCIRLLKRQDSYHSPAWIKWRKLRFWFYVVTVPVLIVLVPWVMKLAVTK